MSWMSYDKLHTRRAVHTRIYVSRQRGGTERRIQNTILVLRLGKWFVPFLTRLHEPPQKSLPDFLVSLEAVWRLTSRNRFAWKINFYYCNTGKCGNKWLHQKRIVLRAQDTNISHSSYEEENRLVLFFVLLCFCFIFTF